MRAFCTIVFRYCFGYSIIGISCALAITLIVVLITKPPLFSSENYLVAAVIGAAVGALGGAVGGVVIACKEMLGKDDSGK